MATQFQIALTGNPNSGKTSLFNALTGLNQKVGNFPGVTVDKKTGTFHLAPSISARITDLPGTYSLYPKSADEYVAYETLLNPKASTRPDVIVVVADAANLKRNLLFTSQITDLKKPIILALSMMDVAQQKGMQIDIAALERSIGFPVIPVNPRTGKGLLELKNAMLKMAQQPYAASEPFVSLEHVSNELINHTIKITNATSEYSALHLLCAGHRAPFLTLDQQTQLAQLKLKYDFKPALNQAQEVMARYRRIDQIIENCCNIRHSNSKSHLRTDRLDAILLHRFWGNIILLLVLFVMFQSVFWLATIPMDLIDTGFSSLGAAVQAALPSTWWADLIVNGLIAGIGGIVIFIPQIATLFFLITILEDTGYMARISFLTDRVMRAAGLNGRSIMPLISGMACAIPAVMAARTIENKKERLITILVTPLMSCSARLPVYTILISLIIPPTTFFNFINLQGLVLMGMYLLGFSMALIVSKVLHTFIKTKEYSLFLMELPVYHAPRWKNAFITMYEKARIFVLDAGKIILIISLALWVLASFGPPSRMQAVEHKYAEMAARQELSIELKEAQQTELLENSYAGILGKFIEPAIAPLGYDWKMGIALISSFAAREVFVGTMATLYSVGENDDDNTPLREKMASLRKPDGTPVYSLATGLSLMIFYAFALQCMSTIAIVKRETQSWKWALIQLLYMTTLAYFAALLVYQVLM
jgi:ferrous iron transport protein B